MLTPSRLINPAPENTYKTFENSFLKKVIVLVEQHYDDTSFGIRELATDLWLSPSQLYRKLRALTGRSPAIFVRSLRLLKAKDLLLHTDLTITEVAYQTGFSELTYFSHAFSVEFGVCPSTFRRKYHN
ncbi:MAG: helix-turn-helix domain-containing protein [Saprospiraceae bacterium]